MKWRATRLKYLASLPITNGLGEQGRDAGEGSVRYLRTTDIAGPRTLDPSNWASLEPELARRAPVQRGDLLICAAGSLGVTYLHDSDESACYAGYLARFRPGPEVDPRFVSYWAQSQGFLDQIATGAVRSTIDNFSAGKIRKLEISVPPLDEQRRIADFLDAETAHLDSVQRLRNEQLALLEGREATALTEILDDPAVRRVRLGYLATLQSGVTVGGTRPRDGLIERPYLRVANVKEDRLELDSVTTIRVTPQEARGSHLRPGDVLMTEGGDLDKLGRGTVWRGEIPGCLHQNHVFALRCGASLLPEYLSYFTRAAPARGYFRETGVKTTNLASTNSTKVRNLRVPLPSVATQRERVEQIEHVLRQSGDLRTLLDRQASLVAERRQALITAAVTGQFDVTTARPYGAQACGPTPGAGPSAPGPAVNRPDR